MTNQLFGNFLYTDAGAAIVGATVDLFDRNTTTPVRATTTTDASGYWSISHATEGRFDVRITNGSSIRWHKYDLEEQITTLEVANFRVRNPADTFEYDIVPAAITADRQLNLPLIGATRTLVANNTALADNESIIFGTGADASILYDGTNLVINPQLVGTGVLDLAAGILELNNAVRFDTGVAIVAATYSVGRDADGTNQLHLNVPTGASFEFSINDVALISTSGTTVTVTGTLNATTLQEGGAGVPNVNDNLSVFAATTSAQLAGVISDETGSGALVFGTSPTLTTPTLSGVATGTWVARWSGGTAITAAQYEITRDADATNQLHFNVPTGATFEFSVNDAVEMTLSATAVNFQNNSITTTGGGSLTGTWTDLGSVTTVDINGGTVDGVTIGGASAGAGTFTTLTATGVLVGASDLNLQNNDLINVGNANSDWTSTAFRSAVAGQFDSSLTVLNGGSNPATAGTIRLPNSNDGWLAWRNNANTSNMGLQLSTTDVLTLRDVAATSGAPIFRVYADGNGNSPIVDVFVESSATGAADPQLRLTVNGGTSWATVVDNSNSDRWELITGATPGTNVVLYSTAVGVLGIPSMQAAAAATNVSYNASGELQQDTSSIRWKERVEDFADWRSILTGLRPREFDWKAGVNLNGVGTRDFGFIAEEALDVDRRLVSWNEGHVQSVRYQLIVSPLVAGWQDHDRRLIEQETRWSSHEERIAALEQANEVLRGQLERAGIVPEK